MSFGVAGCSTAGRWMMGGSTAFPPEARGPMGMVGPDVRKMLAITSPMAFVATSVMMRVSSCSSAASPNWAAMWMICI